MDSKRVVSIAIARVRKGQGFDDTLMSLNLHFDGSRFKLVYMGDDGIPQSSAPTPPIGKFQIIGSV
jgi:hypothetical protein